MFESTRVWRWARGSRTTPAAIPLALIGAALTFVALNPGQTLAAGRSATVATNPGNGAAGTTVTVSGSGFRKSMPITLTWAGSSVGMPALNTLPNSTFSAALTLPSDPIGSYVLRASDGTTSASTSVQIVASATPTSTNAATPTATSTASPTATATATPPTSASPTPTSTSTTTGLTYYLSPIGSDANPGTPAQPWASFYRAAATLRAGDTAIFTDGTYNETQYRAYTAFANSGSGTPGQADYLPITLRAANPRKAILNFTNKPGGVNATAVWIGTNDRAYARKNIVIRDMVFTQPSMGSNYSDGLVRCWAGSDNCQLINNVFQNAYEPVKFSNNAGSVLDSNLFRASNVGFGAFGATAPIIRYNEFQNITQDGIQTKGGTTDAQVYGNLIHTLPGGPAMSVGMYLGGGSCGSSCGVVNVQTGYEGDHVAAWNNVVAGASTAPVSYGAIVFQGCNQCTSVNNDVVNASVSTRIIANGGWPQPDGTTRYVPSVNPSILNQITTNCTYPVFYSGGPTPGANDLVGRATIDYNIFHACGSYGLPAMAHPVVGDPLFVDPLADWHLRSGSPASGSGTVATMTSTTGSSVNVAFNRDGQPRSTPWNLGQY